MVDTITAERIECRSRSIARALRRSSAAWACTFADWRMLLAPALTLSVLLSVDTLKTCVVVDAITRTRHDSNRELRAQGAGNIASALLGGMPGAGTMGATMVSLASGGRTRGAGQRNARGSG